MVNGVNTPYTKKLIIEGVGFGVAMAGSEITMKLGFSHEIKVTVPEGLDVAVEKNSITVTGIDKELVGQFTAKIRSYKKPEPYTGKGIRYEGEYIRRKQGKRAA